LHRTRESDIQLLSKHEDGDTLAAEEIPKVPSRSPTILRKIEPLEADDLPIVEFNDKYGASNDCESENKATFESKENAKFTAVNIMYLDVFIDMDESENQ
jgi:hypothetical protein